MHGLLGELRRQPGFVSLFYLEPFYRIRHELNSRLVLDQTGLVHTGNMIRLIRQAYADIHGPDQLTIKLHFLLLVTYLSGLYTGERNAFARCVFDLAESVAYLESHFHQPIRLADLAARAHVSVRHYTRIFRLNYHCSPVAYIQQLRLQQARRLLLDKPWSITRVAAECGFYDVSALSRAFVRQYAQSPGAFRRISPARS